MLTVSACTSEGPLDFDGPSNQKFSSDTSDRIQAALQEAATGAGASGAIAGVWAPWAGSWEGAVGSTTPGGNTATTTDMTFRAGQLSGMMTCAVFLSMVEDGVVGLDDAVTKYLTHQSEINDITLRQLCQNTSGIADYEPSLRATFAANPTRMWPEGELVANGLVHSPLSAPGQQFNYSQTNTILLGRALKSASMKSWDELSHKYLIDRLGLKNTTFPDPTTLTVPGNALPGYTLAAVDGGFNCTDPVAVPEASPSMGGNAGSAVTSVIDLQRIAAGYMNGNLLDEKLTGEIFNAVPIYSPTKDAEGNEVPITPEQAAVNETQGFGLGVAKYGELWGLGGATPGYSNAILHDPATDLTIVVALNNSTVGSDYALTLAKRLAAIVAESAPDGAPTLTWNEEQTAGALAETKKCE
nr:serine hydrolase domain-containing protein [Lysinibacter cavernae]